MSRETTKAVKVLLTFNGCDTPYGEIVFYKGSGIRVCDARYMIQHVIYECHDGFFADTNCKVQEID